jgi:DNA helicase-2/ATP-dependent DNA helicase PcrA
MTSRIGRPDTDADRELRNCLDQQPTSSFIMVAGAGSGKTTSLVKALAHLDRRNGPAMRKHGRQIACITFTEIAVGEIREDVGDSKLFHVSTIHSFLWTIVHSFQADLREWVAGRINEKIAEAQERLDKPRTRATTRARLTKDIARYNDQLLHLPAIPRFKYGTGSNYAEGLLGHDDILRVGPALIEQYPLIRSVVAQRFPFIFVDESQDTDPTVVAALKRIGEMPGNGFCVGFFGDPMQKIYLAGAGTIERGEGWNEITKPENFRCPIAVLNVINNIRAEDDGLQQIAANRIGPDGPIATPQGAAKLFIASTGQERQRSLKLVRQWMAEYNADPLWQRDERESDVKLLVLVHRTAARRLGFLDLYAALNDNDSTSMKEGLLDGTAWVLRPFITYLLRLVRDDNKGEDFEVMSALRNNCPLLARDRLAGATVAAVLTQLRTDLNTLVQMLAQGSPSTIRDVISFVHHQDLAKLDERFIPYIQGNAREHDEAQNAEPDEESAEEQSVLAFLAVPATQLWGYLSYIEDQSPFSTQHGIKGAEFQRVLVVLDDEESEYRLFSYGRYWGTEPLSATDQAHIASHEDSVVDRTRRLFYVCCSRALKDLAVVFFVPNVQVAHAVVLAKRLFRPEDVHILGEEIG